MVLGVGYFPPLSEKKAQLTQPRLALMYILIALYQCDDGNLEETKVEEQKRVKH